MEGEEGGRGEGGSGGREGREGGGREEGGEMLMSCKGS